MSELGPGVRWEGGKARCRVAAGVRRARKWFGHLARTYSGRPARILLQMSISLRARRTQYIRAGRPNHSRQGPADGTIFVAPLSPGTSGLVIPQGFG